MSVTAKLVRLHRVEIQIRGLTERLHAAERYLSAQDEALAELDAKLTALRGQLRQLEVALKNDENEAATFEARIQKLREQMNSAKTNKEYTTFLTEINTIKADKSRVEEKELASMTKVEEVRAEVAKADAERADRAKVRGVAKADRDQREAEIRDRLEELRRERAVAAADVPERALKAFEGRIAQGHDDIMAALEEHDRRNREYCCGACQVLLPLEKLNALVGRGELTACTNCGALLYLEEEVKGNVVATRK